MSLFQVLPVLPVLAGGLALQEPPAWSLSEMPVVEIGSDESDPNHQLHRANGSMLLPDGNIVILNGGSQELLYFDSSGEYQGRTGGRGEGPGEFQFPVRLYPVSPDSIAVLDRGAGRMVILDERGTYGRSYAHTGDTWMYRRHWMIGPRDAASKSDVRAVIDRMPALEDGRMRYVRVGADGYLWTLDTGIGDEERPSTWHIYDTRGRAIGELQTTADWELQEAGDDYVLARERTDMDVEIIRMYRLIKPNGSNPGFDNRLALGPASSGEDNVDAAAVGPVRGLLRMLATAQEQYWANNEEYSSNVRRLSLSVPDGIELELLWAGERGWVAFASQADSDVGCVMALGRGIPLGWPGGAAVCG